MSTRRSPNDTRYSDCKLIVTPSGLAGYAIAVKGDATGRLFDFFVSPREHPLVAYGLMSLALECGANTLVTFDHILLARFFEQFGFEAVCRLSARGAPPSWVPEGCGLRGGAPCPDFLYMLRRSTRPSDTLAGHLRSRDAASDASHARCARCAHAVGDGVREPAFAGYECARCGSLFVYGTLTLGPPDLAHTAREEAMGDGLSTGRLRVRVGAASAAGRMTGLSRTFKWLDDYILPSVAVLICTAIPMALVIIIPDCIFGHHADLTPKQRVDASTKWSELLATPALMCGVLVLIYFFSRRPFGSEPSSSIPPDTAKSTAVAGPTADPR